MSCKNCNTSLTNSINFCPECGAKVIENRLTFRNISTEINDQFFNLDNKILKTFIDLVTKPEVVINDFIRGTRKKHINVMQYFALSLTLVGLQVFLMNTFFKDAINLDMSFMDNLKELPSQKENPFIFNFEEVNNYQSLIYVFSIPFSALSTWLAYFIIGDRRFNFTEHIVINLYYSAQVIIVSTILTILLLCFGVNYIIITSIIFILTLVYFFYVLKRVFNTSFFDSLARFILVMLVLSLMFFALFIMGIIIAIIYKLL